ncbi:MAG: hypothetical protein IPP69_07010 [Flavobacteriales bacterium]|nr:hypothetical protein [Flavobacteriales bacterium]
MKWNRSHMVLVAMFFMASLTVLASGQSVVQEKNRKVIEKNIPGEQEPNLDGVVEVSFKIDQLGKVQILNINSTSPQLSEYVIKKLSKIQLSEGNTQVGKVIKYRFVFKKQA